MSHHPSPDPGEHDLFELASAHLDGVLTADELADAQARTGFSEAVASLEAVRQALRSAPDPVADPARRDEALRVALAAFDDDTVVGFAPVRPRKERRRWVTWGLPVAALGAAAAVITVVALGASTSRDDLPTDVASVSATTVAPSPDALRSTESAAGDEAAGTAAADGSEATVVAGGADVTAASAAPPADEAPLVEEPVDLDDLATLGQRLRAGELAAPATAPSCAAAAPELAYAGTVVWTDGQVIEIFVNDTEIAAVAVDGCTELGQVPIG
jgi:hypothetical protein